MSQFSGVSVPSPCPLAHHPLPASPGQPRPAPPAHPCMTGCSEEWGQCHSIFSTYSFTSLFTPSAHPHFPASRGLPSAAAPGILVPDSTPLGDQCHTFVCQRQPKHESKSPQAKHTQSFLPNLPGGSNAPRFLVTFQGSRSSQRWRIYGL